MVEKTDTQNDGHGDLSLVIINGYIESDNAIEVIEEHDGTPFWAVLEVPTENVDAFEKAYCEHKQYNTDLDLSQFTSIDPILYHKGNDGEVAEHIEIPEELIQKLAVLELTYGEAIEFNNSDPPEPDLNEQYNL
ncbi:MAG: hypothetical protein ACRBCK_10285 [Alphaproteobacteria bacterium]